LALTLSNQIALEKRMPWESLSSRRGADIGNQRANEPKCGAKIWENPESQDVPDDATDDASFVYNTWGSWLRRRLTLRIDPKSNHNPREFLMQLGQISLSSSEETVTRFMKLKIVRIAKLRACLWCNSNP
jgi:hypothetical protein